VDGSAGELARDGVQEDAREGRRLHDVTMLLPYLEWSHWLLFAPLIRRAVVVRYVFYTVYRVAALRIYSVRVTTRAVLCRVLWVASTNHDKRCKARLAAAGISVPSFSPTIDSAPPSHFLCLAS
jgi:hypothetical protein